ncbi:hypothetical protein [Dactylosporangium sp. CA-139066]|uniref:hypothetical protein n=1 Tax=Dactylosporangium sp. CA-139066 TaxID=3239930 RepID=UPI003D8D2E02
MTLGVISEAPGLDSRLHGSQRGSSRETLMTMSVKLRRRVALGLAAGAVVVAVVTVFAAVDGGPGAGGHVHLWTLAHPFVGVAIAGAMLVGAAQLAVQHRIRRLSSQAAAALITVFALCSGEAAHYGTFSDLSEASVVATSVKFEIVSYRSAGFFSSDTIVLRLRTREGIASREGRDDLACFITPESGAGPEWLFGRAEVTGKDEIAVFAKDGTMWRIRFNARTLSAVEPLDRCRDAPDIMDD